MAPTHTTNHASRSRLLAVLAAVLLAGSLGPRAAFASDSLDQIQTQADALVAKVEQTTAAYREAEAKVEDLEAQISANEKREAELNAQLPIQRAHTAASIKSMYLFQQSSGSLLELILSSEDFNDFLSVVRYIDAIHTRNVEQIKALNSMVDELAQTQAVLVVERDAALTKREEALAALEQARLARTELQTHVVAIAATEEDIREEAIEVVRAAIEEAEAASEDLPTFTTTSGNEAVLEVPETPSVSTEPLVTNTTSEETDDWAARIDEYLKGSPLEGYGATFAEAAATYGVDPRLSPAIATIESGKGTYCFEEHNAWGWGSSGWDDWESAIYEQVEGLATGYDGTLTLEGAERYCPPNYQEWYSSVASEMDTI